MQMCESHIKKKEDGKMLSCPNYPDWVEERFGDDIPAWAEERWGDEEDKNDEKEEND